MAKDPAVLFYTSDFLSGVMDLDMEERGQYITLLCAQHQKGHLSEKTIRLLVGSVSVSVLEKFTVDLHGLYYNQRMEEEISKRLNFIDSRVENGKKGGRPKKPNENLMVNHMPNLPENENENRNINDNKGIGGMGEKGFFEKSVNDEGWQEVVMRTCKINNPVFWINEFNDHSIATQEHYNTIADFRRHCVNWIKIELKKQTKDGKQTKSARSEMDKLRDWYDTVNAPTTGNTGQ